VVGYSHEAKAVRVFAVERIQGIEVTEEMFEIPKTFSLEERFDRGFGLIDGELQDVKIWISPDWAYYVKERSWHPTQKLQAQKDGSVILTMRCGGIDELTAWVLSFGPGAKVLGPQALIDNVSSQLTAAARSYRSSK
jgi:proteasome accessory factor B